MAWLLGYSLSHLTVNGLVTRSVIWLSVTWLLGYLLGHLVCQWLGRFRHNIKIVNGTLYMFMDKVVFVNGKYIKHFGYTILNASAP